MSRYDRIILAAIIGLGLVIAGLSVASARLGPTVDTLTTAELLDGTLVNSQIAITFTQPMRIQTVEHSFSLQPYVAGDFAWSGNQMRYIPRKTLQYATSYRISIGVGAEDSGGKHLTHTYESTFRTQTQHLVYIGTTASERDHLVMASISGKHKILGPSDGLVTDFSPSTDRTLIAFAKRGGETERSDEIWLLSLADNSSQRIFRHADWDISQPHFSPDNRYVTFLAGNVQICRQYYGCYRDTRPEIYLLDLRSRHAFPFQARSDVPLTNFVDFSPRGQLAYTDLGSALTLADTNGTNIIHIPNRGNSLEFAGFDPVGDKAAFVGQTPSSTGGDIVVYWKGKYVDASRGVYDSSVPSFSSSGARLAYAAYRGEQGIEPIYGVNVYTMNARATSRVTSELHMSDWAPVWSVDDSYIAFVRSQPQEAMYMGTGEVWVVRADGTAARPLGGIGRNVRWVM